MYTEQKYTNSAGLRQVPTPSFVKASRQTHPCDTTVDLGHNVTIGGDSLVIFAGPCSVEGDNLFRIARSVKESGASVLRGGAFKPRTSPYACQGMGKEGLLLLKQASQELDMPVVTEIVDVRDIDLFLDLDIDIFQIGARNSTNYALLKEVGKTQKPVLLKRGPASTIDEFLLSAEYILSEGNPNVILCERGIRSFESYTRNTFDIAAIPVLKQLTHLPVIADPSHATGHACYVEDMALASVAARAAGLIIEVHDQPQHAWSDGEQALTPRQLDDCVRKAFAIKNILS